MGDMADYYKEGEMHDEVTRPNRETLWYTADGRAIKIKDLEDDHLLNIIRCFRGMSPEGTKVFSSDPKGRMQWVNALANEAYARGLALDGVAEGEPIHE